MTATAVQKSDTLTGRASASPRRPARGRVLAPAMRTPSGVIGMGVLVVWVLVATTWQLWAPNPLATDALAALQAPSLAHPFGTDSLGRDVFARVVAGSTSALVIGPAATALAMVAGVLVGGFAGYLGGVVDEVLMRIMDFVLAFPGIIIAILLLGLFDSDMATLICLLGIFFTPLVARTTRGAVIAVKGQEYVEAARLRGERTPYIVFGEIIPNISGTLVVEATVRLSSAIVTAASLSFIGLGVQPPTPDWGLTIATEAPYLTIAWWSALFPSLALASLVIGVSLLAEGFREGQQR